MVVEGNEKRSGHSEGDGVYLQRIKITKSFLTTLVLCESIGGIIETNL
jgi:hypothetical protein